MKALAVMPRISPRSCVVMTVTPVTNEAMTRRKSGFGDGAVRGGRGMLQVLSSANDTKSGGTRQGNVAHLASGDFSVRPVIDVSCRSATKRVFIDRLDLR